MTAKIVWLASYPKSGNTWFRAFLSTIRQETITSPDINDLYSTPIASSRGIFEAHAGLESSDLTLDETDRLRPDVYRHLADTLEETMFMKVHDAYTKTAAGEWMFPPEVTRAVIYLVRNPLDVAVSFANHNSQGINLAVENLCNKEFCLCRGIKNLPNQLRQIHLTWSGHVASWLESPNSVCVLRYEDMKLNPFATFKRAVQFLELDKSDEEVQAAIETCSFDKLQNQEKKNSFNEKPQKCQSFFRKGIVGDWRAHLTEKQVDRIIKSHYEMMKRLNYLDAQDQLTV